MPSSFDIVLRLGLSASAKRVFISFIGSFVSLKAIIELNPGLSSWEVFSSANNLFSSSVPKIESEGGLQIVVVNRSANDHDLPVVS
jgi:hypothetical protein